MKDVKHTLEKVKGKKWGKEEWLILILVGILLLIVFYPKSKAETEIPDMAENNEFIETQIGCIDFSYKNQMEMQLEDVLKSIDGIDNVHAMITFKGSQEEVVLKEISLTEETTKEEDTAGGVREILTGNTEETVCYSNTSKENSTPYIIHTKAPEVEGVLIVVGGKNAGTLRIQIVQAVQALFDVDSHKVVVIKMKEA